MKSDHFPTNNNNNNEIQSCWNSSSVEKTPMSRKKEDDRCNCTASRLSPNPSFTCSIVLTRDPIFFSLSFSRSDCCCCCSFSPTPRFIWLKQSLSFYFQIFFFFLSVCQCQTIPNQIKPMIVFHLSLISHGWMATVSIDFFLGDFHLL